MVTRGRRCQSVAYLYDISRSFVFREIPSGLILSVDRLTFPRNFHPFEKIFSNEIEESDRVQILLRYIAYAVTDATNTHLYVTCVSQARRKRTILTGDIVPAGFMHFAGEQLEADDSVNNDDE